MRVKISRWPIADLVRQCRQIRARDANQSSQFPQEYIGSAMMPRRQKEARQYIADNDGDRGVDLADDTEGCLLPYFREYLMADSAQESSCSKWHQYGEVYTHVSVFLSLSARKNYPPILSMPIEWPRLVILNSIYRLWRLAGWDNCNYSRSVV
jgi:hypothetical protein